MIWLVLAFVGSTSAIADEPPLVEALQQLGEAVGAGDGAPDIEALMGAGLGDLGDLLGDSASGGIDLGGLMSGGGADLAAILSGSKASAPIRTTPILTTPTTPTAQAPATSFGAVPSAGPARVVVVGEEGEAPAALSLSGDHRVVPVLLPGVHVTHVDGGEVPLAWATAVDACMTASPGGRLVLRLGLGKAEVMFEENPGEAAPVVACLGEVPQGAWQITRAPAQGAKSAASGGVVVHH